MIFLLLGIIPHLLWFCFKYLRGNLRNDSLFEINKLNSIKLNESIWNIKLNKKAFYEGAVNPVFEEDEIEEVVDESAKDEEKNNVGEDLKGPDGAKVVVEKEQKNDFKSTEDVTNYRSNKSSIFEHSPIKDESVQWECVAEIHTEEIAPENYELQIVENTYNFLSHIIEEGPKDEVSSQKNDFNLNEESLDLSTSSKEASSNIDGIIMPSTTLIETPNQLSDDELQKSDLIPSLIVETEEQDTTKIEFKKTKNSNLQISENKFEPGSEVPATFLKQNFNETCAKEPSSSSNNLETKKKLNNSKEQETNSKLLKTEQSRKKEKAKGTEKNNPEEKMFKLKNDEHLKNFKEKLNLLLKNQINMNGSLKEAILKYRTSPDESGEDEKNKNDDLVKIRTLNKSQIKNKLEILLAKGPPKRSSLRNSFNIKLEANNET